MGIPKVFLMIFFDIWSGYPLGKVKVFRQEIEEKYF
jgi:hypothetical protein